MHVCPCTIRGGWEQVYCLWCIHISTCTLRFVTLHVECTVSQSSLCPCDKHPFCYRAYSPLCMHAGQQLYQWSCSAVESSSNLHSLPDLPVTDSRNLVSEPTRFGAPRATELSFYPVPPTLNCTGTVLAVDFCYSEYNRDHFDTEEHVFTLLTLNKNGFSFTVSDVIPVHSKPSSGICTNYRFSSSNVRRYCCDRFMLDSQDWFSLPAPNFAFGITTFPRTSRNLLAYHVGDFSSLRVREFRYNIDEDPIAGATINLTEQQRFSDRALMMFNFVLGKFSRYTTLPSLKNQLQRCQSL